MGDGDKPTDEFDREPGSGPPGVAEAPLIAPGRLLGERYRLERRLGHGGMAVVWLATDERLGRSVAVKVISDTIAHDRDYLVRFRREAHVAAGLQHPNLVGVYDFDAGLRPYLVMEYVSGGDLAERLARDQVPDAQRLTRELLSALRHIHAGGVLHRDIKPQNVLIDELGNARLTDFGIAQPANATSLTRTGSVIGTESYIAPEVKAGEPASERSDLYALGVVLGDTAGDDAGAELWDLIHRLRDPIPERRPQSAAAAMATLDRGATTRIAAGAATAPYAIDPPWGVGRVGAARVRRSPARPTPARPSFEPTGSVQRSGGKGRWLAAGALATVIAALIVGLALGTGGDDGGSGGNGNTAAAGNQAEEGSNSGSGTDEAVDPASPTEDEEPAPVEEPEEVPVSSSEDGYALEAAGYQAFRDGDYEAAIEASSQAVELLRDTGDPKYYFALFNIGTSLRHAGRPDEALPYLQERLEYGENLDVVEDEIALVESQIAEGDEKPGNGPKSTPPGLEGD